MVRQHIKHINLRITKPLKEQKPLSKGEVFGALLQQPRRNARQPGSVFNQFFFLHWTRFSDGRIFYLGDGFLGSWFCISRFS